MRGRQLGAVATLVVAGALIGGTGSWSPVAGGATPERSPAANIRPPRIAGQRCDACHSFDPTLSHPVNVVPGLEVPSHLPLVDGRLTCTTCHVETADTRTHGALRGAAGTLCVQCHDGARRSAADLHAQTLGVAHLPSAARRWGGILGTAGLDAETTACLGCHDDLLATGVPHEPITSRRRGRGHDSHPIATPYRRTGAPDPYDGLRHPDLVDPRIRLFDGKLGCGSCHSVYAREPGLLVMPNDRSRLCVSCHDL